MTSAPATLIALLYMLVANLHTTNLGIVGDAAHIATGGYHIGAASLRAHGMSNDYSLEYAPDRNATHDYACAIDIGGSADVLMTLGDRIVHALKAQDPRVYNRIRGVNAPFDGQGIDRRFDTESPNNPGDDNVQTSDDRNHIHIEVFRTLVEDQGVIDALYDVLAAGGAPSAPSAPSAPTPSQKLYQGAGVPGLIAQGSGQYLGSISGPDASHGGYNPSEKPIVRELQQRLIVCGFVPGVSDPNSGWADGIYDTPQDSPNTGATSRAVAAFQQQHMPGTTYFGQCWWDDWTKLFNL